MEDLTFNSENAAPITGKVTKGASGTVVRKKLADISNLRQQPRIVEQDDKYHFSTSTTIAYNEKLEKENKTLKNILAEKNKFIELTGIELQKLRVTLQKTQQQNLHLVKANSQMLAELNSGKDRLKAMQHELGCKNSLLKALMEGEDKSRSKTCQNLENEDKSTKSADPVEARDGEKQKDTKRRRRSESLGPGPSSQVQSEDKAGTKRLKPEEEKEEESREDGSTLLVEDNEARESGRRSIRGRVSRTTKKVKVQMDKENSVNEETRRTELTTESILEPESSISASASEANIAVNQEARESGRRSIKGRLSRTTKKVKVQMDKENTANEETGRTELTTESIPEPESSTSASASEANIAVSEETREVGRASICRPSRQAALKVQSYKEIPRNIKMRRPG